MQSFKSFLIEYAVTDSVITLLNDIGYSKIKKVQGRIIAIMVDSNSERVKALKDIATQLGGNFQPISNKSSVGETQLSDKITIVAKTAGGGSGAGAAVTKLTESAQCLYLADRWYKGGKYSAESLHGAANSVNVDEPINNIVDNLDDVWRDSCILTAEKLHKESLYKGKKYIFHRGSAFIARIDNQFKKLNKIEKLFTNLNKWTPADIWMATSKAEALDIEGTQSILELNNLILNAGNEGILVGVSLKQAQGKVSLEKKNFTEKRKEYQFTKFTTGKRSFFQSNDVYIQYDGGEIQFRTFGSTWQGEIKGKFANQGKISGGPVAVLMKNIGRSLFMPQKTLGIKTEDNLRKFYDYYTTLGEPSIKYSDFKKKVDEKDATFFMSKIMGAQLLFQFNKLSKTMKTKVITAMIGYAASESEMSAAYVKAS